MDNDSLSTFLLSFCSASFDSSHQACVFLAFSLLSPRPTQCQHC
jgi:hypothetical protein